MLTKCSCYIIGKCSKQQAGVPRIGMPIRGAPARIVRHMVFGVIVLFLFRPIPIRVLDENAGGGIFISAGGAAFGDGFDGRILALGDVFEHRGAVGVRRSYEFESRGVERGSGNGREQAGVRFANRAGSL